MIITPDMPEALTTRVYKDGIDISSDCMEVDSEGIYAICVVRDEDGFAIPDYEHGAILKKRIENVEVVINE